VKLGCWNVGSVYVGRGDISAGILGWGGEGGLFSFVCVVEYW